MKQFIVLMAVLPILLLFMLQFTYDQRTNQIIGQVQAIVYAAKEEAKQVGCFTEEMKGNIKADIGRATGVSPDEVQVISDGVVKYRYAAGENRLIYYTVRVPIEEVMAGSAMFRIDPSENKYIYVIDSYTASEKV